MDGLVKHELRLARRIDTWVFKNHRKVSAACAAAALALLGAYWLLR